MKSRASIWEVVKDTTSPRYVEVRDLLMSTASEISHPDYLSGNISGVYIFFGIARSYSPPKNSKGDDKINADWSTVDEDQTLIKSANKPRLYRRPIDEEDPKIRDVQKKLRVIAKHNNPHLEGINRFLQLELLDEFYFIKPKGWCRINESLSVD